MLTPLERENKDIRVVVKCGASFVDRANQAANELFEGDRSKLIRTAVNDFLDRKQIAKDVHEPEAA